MRTKHILTALVLPALFAACTADDFESSVVGGVEAQRAQLSKDLKLDFGGAETRFTAGDPNSGLTFTFQENDTVGGAIIDQYTPGSANEFPVVEYISTNHPFVKTGAQWAIKHTMVEGNYLFYYPYNENNHSRDAVRYSIPVLQDLTGKDGKFNPKAAVEKYNMAVAAKFLDKEDLSVSTNLLNLYGYAKIQVVLDNTYPGGYVDKIVLQDTDNNDGFALEGKISNKKIADLFAKEGEEYKEAVEDLNTTAALCLENGDALYEVFTPSQVMVAKAPEGTALKVDGQNNKTFETYLIMPAAEYDNVDIYLYTTTGDVYKGNLIGNTGVEINRNKIKTLNVSVSKSETTPYVVTSEADWNKYVSLLKKDSRNNEFIIAGDDFSVTNSTKFPSNGAKIQVSGELSVSGNNVTIKGVEAETIVVEEGAKLTTNKTFSADLIENKGELVIAKILDENNVVDTYTAVEAINNNPGATLTIAEEAEAEFLLNNQMETKRSKALEHGMVVNNGLVKLDANSQNSGEILNNGQLSGNLTNNVKIESKDVDKDGEPLATYIPTINNAGVIFADGTYTNEGKIVNAKDSEISCSDFGGTFNNAGTITLADGSRCLISNNSSNGNNGEIILEKLNQANWAVRGTKGTIAYTTGAADAGKSYDFDTVGAGVTKIYVNGNLGVTKFGALEAIVIEKNATLALPKNANWSGKLTVVEGAAAIVTTGDASKNEEATISNLVVEEKASVTINKGSNLTATTVKNEGTIYVGGTFTTSTTEKQAKADGGVFKNTGTSSQSNIKFGDDQATIDRKAEVEAVKALVLAYANTTENEAVKSWIGIEAYIKNGNYSSGVWVEIADNFKNATGVDIATYFAETEKASIIAEGIAAAKSAINVTDVLKAKYPTNKSWLDDSKVYTQEKDQKVQDIESKDGVNMYNAFIAVAKKLTKDDLDVENAGAAYLSIQDAADATIVAAIPAHSYIAIYEGTDTYKAAKMWKDATDKFSSASWWTGLSTYAFSTTYTSNTLVNMQQFFGGMKDASEDMSTFEANELKKMGILDMVDTVLDWDYTNGQIEALTEAVDK